MHKRQPVPFSDQSFVVTGSFGVASGAAEIEDLVNRADAAMYRAKQAGRNRVTADERGSGAEGREMVGNLRLN